MNIEVYTDVSIEKRYLADVISSLKEANDEPLRILEAGCGRRWPMTSIPGTHITGIDLDKAALDARLYSEGDLDEAILGDIVTYPFDDSSFDVIYSSYVLEHVKEAERAMSNFVQWLKPGGLIMIQIPVIESSWGWITKHTPHAVHIWFYRHFRGRKLAGTPGHGPYPTFYQPIVSIRGMAKFANANNLEVVQVYGQRYWMSGLERLLTRAVTWLSLGRLKSEFNNVGFILRKAASPRIEVVFPHEETEKDDQDNGNPTSAFVNAG